MTQKKKELVVRVADFSLIAGQLYKMGLDKVLCRYVPAYERHSILDEEHGGVVGGHYAGKATTQNILHAGLWWTKVHKYSKEY